MFSDRLRITKIVLFSVALAAMCLYNRFLPELPTAFSTPGKGADRGEPLNLGFASVMRPEGPGMVRVWLLNREMVIPDRGLELERGDTLSVVGYVTPSGISVVSMEPRPLRRFKVRMSIPAALIVVLLLAREAWLKFSHRRSSCPT